MSGKGSDDVALTATLPEPSTTPRAPAVTPSTLGRYRLEGVLGAGGMGIVHAAFDIDLERRVAIKLLHSDPSPTTRSRLLQEARAMARLAHPNVVSIYEVDSIDGVDFVVMELVDGGTVIDWLREAKRSVSDILEAFVAAGRGLSAAHAAGMVHRDFKPHNVLRNQHGKVLVTDFGLARESSAVTEISEGGSPTPLAGLTQTGAVVGTPAYMAPEQWASGTVSAAADQFAFCVGLWEALSGARPFRGATTAELRAQIEAGPAALDTTNIPRRLRPVLLRGLDPDPARRWPSMDALLSALVPRRRTELVLAARVIAVAGALALGVKLFGGSSASEPKVGPADPGVGVVVPRSRAALIDSIQRIDATHVTVPRATVEQLLRDRSELADGARAVATTVDEQVVGFRLYAVRPRSVHAAFGFRDLDLIRAIDELPLTTDANVLAAFKRARTATTMTITFDRGGRPVQLTVEITP